jgi:TonB family protein
MAEPSSEDLARAYPQEALNKGLNGHTVVDCTVKPDGYLENCTVANETPPGVGFGQASLALAEKFRVKPGTVKPDAAGVAHISIPMRWAMVTDPDWIERPNGNAFASEYPRRALMAGVSGQAVIRCIVSADGRLSHCVISSESPLGFGFGEATLRIVSHFRMRPAQVDGQAAAGGVVVIPVNWKVEGRSTVGGLAAFLITLAHGDEKKSDTRSVSCPTPNDPKRRCVVHQITLQASPSAEQLGKLLAGNKELRGRSHETCTVGEDGELKNCIANQEATPAQQAGMQALTAGLKVLGESQDRLAIVGARIVVTFDWDELAFEVKLARDKLQ